MFARAAVGRSALGWLLLLASAMLCEIGRSGACPFCGSVEPTLSERRESAAVAAIVNRVAGADGSQSWQTLRVLKGQDMLAGRELGAILPDASQAAAPAGLNFALGELAGGATAGPASAGPASAAPTSAAPTTVALAWQFIPASEIACSYLLRAPDLRSPSVERLRYFARYLEHNDPLVAEDAFREFGRAGFNDVAAVAEALPQDKLRAWLDDAGTPAARKGFYALALGLARAPEDRRKNLATLRAWIDADQRDAAPGADFRPGFDGVLGGYLLLAGTAGLDELAKRYFDNPAAPEIDVRQAIAALRFYHEHGREIPVAAQCAALRRSLARPNLADQAILDLARWEDWDVVDVVARLATDPAYREPRVRRAVAGYLLLCPRKEAAAPLRAPRAEDPRAVVAAEASIASEGRSSP